MITVLLRFSVPPVREMFSVADNIDDDRPSPIVTIPSSIPIVFAYNPCPILAFPPLMFTSLVIYAFLFTVTSPSTCEYESATILVPSVEPI